MTIQWGMRGPQNNSLEQFQIGAQIGDRVAQAGNQRDTRNALAKLIPMNGQTPGIGDSVDPSKIAEREQAMATLMRQNPEMAMRLQQQRSQQDQAQMERRRADLPFLINLSDPRNNPDQASYERNLQLAQQYNIDVSQFPKVFDPAQVAQFHNTVKILHSPQGQEAASAAGKEAADILRGRFGRDMVGTPEHSQLTAQLISKIITTPEGGQSGMINPVTGYQPLVVPNDGSMAPGAPVSGGAPVRVNTPEEAKALPPGTRFITPDGREKIAGGPASQSPGNFQSAFGNGI